VDISKVDRYTGFIVGIKKSKLVAKAKGNHQVYAAVNSGELIIARLRVRRGVGAIPVYLIGI